VSGKRASTRTASVAAVATALVLGLFAASAFGWYDEGGGNDTTTPTDTVPTVTTPPEEQPPPSPPIVETQPVSPAPASSAVPAAAPPEVAPAITEAVPQEGVKGEIGTRDEGQAGGSKPTVLAQATDTGSPVASESSGGLANTGFDVLFLAILGTVALAGSSLLFWRSRTA
jgi:LPXTG-motif cell wall-anchored protein